MYFKTFENIAVADKFCPFYICLTDQGDLDHIGWFGCLMLTDHNFVLRQLLCGSRVCTTVCTTLLGVHYSPTNQRSDQQALLCILAPHPLRRFVQDFVQSIA